MRCRADRCCCALLALMLREPAGAQARRKYPDWKGQWLRKSAGTFDPGQAFGLGQQAPLTPEYQKVLEESVADQADGGQGNNPMAACIPPGMPRMMIGYGGGFEFIDHAGGHLHDPRRADDAASPHLHRRARAVPQRSSRHFPATRSAAGRATRRTLRHAGDRDPLASKARAPTTAAACRSTEQSDGGARSASISTRATRTSCATTSR